MQTASKAHRPAAEVTNAASAPPSKLDRRRPVERNRDGPIRTLRVGERITVYGDVEIIAIKGRRVQVRVHRASSPPPEPVLLPAPDASVWDRAGTRLVERPKR